MPLHIGINFCPYGGGYGGAETYLKNLVLAMARVGCPHRVSLFISAGLEGHFTDGTEFGEILCGRAGQSRPRRVWCEQHSLPKLIQQHGIDLIFSNYVSPLRARCRQIVNVHDMLYRVHPHYIPGRAKLWYWKTMVPASVRRAETVLTVSRHSADDIRRFFPVAAHKVVVGSQAVSFELAGMDAPERDADLISGMGVTEPFVLCTGGLDRHKNVEGLLQGFEAASSSRRLAPPQVPLAGKCAKHGLRLVLTDPYGRRHCAALREFKNWKSDRIILAGAVSPAQLAALYRRAVVHVAPSRFEGFGRSVIEAQHFGCPNIASLSAALPEIAGDAALYFHPDDPAALAIRLVKLLHNDSLRQELIARGYQNLQRFDWETAARQFIDLCDQGTTRRVRVRVDHSRRRFSNRDNTSWKLLPHAAATAVCRRAKSGRVKRLPLVILMPHSRCNCRCVMCDAWKDVANTRELSVDQISTWRTEFAALKVQRVMLTGGEPLMHGNIERLLGLLNECGLQTTLLSSALLLRRHASAIVECCRDVVVSLGGSRDVHDRLRRVPGAFDRLVDGVQALHEIDPSFPVSGRCTIQRGNYRDWVNTADTAREIGLDSISFQAADVTTTAFGHPQGWEPRQMHEVAVSRSELPELKNTVEKLIRNRAAEITSGFIAEGPDKLRRIADYFAALCGESEHVAPRCNVPWISAVIEADGSVRPCFFHRCFANLNDTSLKGALNSEELVHFRKTLSVADDPICRRCVCSLYLPSERFPKPSRGARGNRASCRA